MDEHVLQWIARFSYPAVFLLLIGGGLGAPVPEDLVLLTSGIVSAQSGGHLPVMIGVAYVGVLVSDGLLYRIGRRLGTVALSRPGLARVLTPKRVAWAQGQFKRRGGLTVFLVRFVPGFRAATLLLAGSCGLSPRVFFVADALAALIYVPLLVFLGNRFGAAVLPKLREAGEFMGAGVAAILVIAAVVALVRRLRLRRRLRRPEPAPGPATVDRP